MTIRHRNFSNTAVPDLNKNVGGSTDLARKWHGSTDLHTPIHLPPSIRHGFCRPKSGLQIGRQTLIKRLYLYSVISLNQTVWLNTFILLKNDEEFPVLVLTSVLLAFHDNITDRTV